MSSDKMLKSLCLLALLIYGIPHLNFSAYGSAAFVFSVLWLSFACITFIAQTKGIWSTLFDMTEEAALRKSESNEGFRETYLKNH